MDPITFGIVGYIGSSVIKVMWKAAADKELADLKAKYPEEAAKNQVAIDQANRQAKLAKLARLQSR